MLRIRILLALVVIGGSIYAAAGLLTSLRDFGIGTAIVALAVCMQGLITYLDEHDAPIMQRYRDDVWARRDGEL